MIHLIPALLLAILVFGGLTGCAPVIFGGVAATAGVVNDRRTTGTVIEDQAIEVKINQAIYDSEEVREQAHINVNSYNMVVLLSGEAPSVEMRDKAEEIARNTEKVREVYNEIVVATPSSLGARGSDTWITAKVKSALFQITDHPDFDPTRVMVITEGGVVYLFGLLTPEESQDVTSTVRLVGGVQKVVTLFEFIEPKEQVLS